MGSASVVSWREISELPGLVAQRASSRRNGAPAPARAEGLVDDAFSSVADDGPLGRLVAVWGPAGAPGRSTVAVGLAAACAERGLPTLLVDADVYGGAISSMLAMLDEVSGILAAARLANTGSLDLPALHQQVREIGPCLRVLTGLPRADRWPQLRPAALAQVLHVARQMAPVVVVDCGFSLEQDEELSFDTAAPRRNGATLTTLERADTVLAVGSADPLGLTRLARGVLDLREAVPGVDAAMVVNRTRSSLGWSRDEVAELPAAHRARRRPWRRRS
jgi:MinD-like ATPase involved in chromosome partitioning or flagellar assembly